MAFDPLLSIELFEARWTYFLVREDLTRNKIQYLLIFLVDRDEILRAIYFWFTSILSIFISVDFVYFCTGSSIFTLSSPIFLFFEFSSFELLVDIEYSIFHLLVTKITLFLLGLVVFAPILL